MFSCAAAALIALSASQANAKRSVVDGNGEVDLSGYCDLNGDQCTPQPLGYSVILGGATYNSFIIYGDGAITLGNTAVSSSTYTNATKLSDYGVPVISSGIDNTPDNIYDGGTIFLQNGYITKNASNHNIMATFEVYLTSSNFKYESTIDISPDAGGLDVKLSNYVNEDYTDVFGFPTAYSSVNPQLAGYFIPGVGDQEVSINTSGFTGDGTYAPTYLEYQIQATVTFGSPSAAPEPSMWMLMTAGIGMAGLALRSRRSARRGWAVRA